MRDLHVLQVDAFTAIPLQGNPAGVVPDALGLSPEEMQAVAREMNCSETAFVLPSDRGDFRLRYFTPAVEVDLCGHATIGALHALRESGRLRGAASVETNVGLLRMEAEAGGMAWMEQGAPAFRPFRGTQPELAALLGLAPDDLAQDLPVGLAYTGLWALLVPVRDRAALRAARPDTGALAEHNRAMGVTSTHLYCRQTELPDSTLHARDFSPAAGVAEDPHTGTASGALGAFLVARGVLPPGRHVFEQGWTVGRPGRIHIEIASGAAGVRVGGEAVTVIDGTIRMADPA